MLGGIYLAIEVVGARDGENEREAGVFPPKRGYRALALDIGPACIMFAVGVVVVRGVRYMWPLRWLEPGIKRTSRGGRVAPKTPILSACAQYGTGRKMAGVGSKRDI